MLKVRVIPTLLWKNEGLVKGTGFNSWRRVGTVMPAIKVYNTRQVDELIVLDITATIEQRDPDYDSIAEFSAECFVPLAMGGGIHRLDQVKRLLRVGADKVCINSAAYENIDLIRQTAEAFGSQCVVGAIDVRKNAQGGFECYSHAGQQATGKSPVEWALALEAAGAGEILITSVERDGTMTGYDVDLIASVSQRVGIPVIASGGAGQYEDFYQAITVGRASAVAAASMYHFTQATPLEAKQYLASRGIPVRNVNVL